MLLTSFVRQSAWAGLAALVSLGAPALAAAPNPAVGARHSDICANSAMSMQLLATIEKPGDDSFQCLGLMMEGDIVKGLRLETHREAAETRHQVAERTEVTEFPLAVVESRRGAVLDGVPGHDAIILRGTVSPTASKAELVASYLYNGFTSEYRSCPITLDRSPNAGWRLINQFDQPVSRIVVRTRDMFIIGPFGIASLDGACTQRAP